MTTIINIKRYVKISLLFPFIALGLLLNINDTRVASTKLSNQRLKGPFKLIDVKDKALQIFGLNGTLPHQELYLLGEKIYVRQIVLRNMIDLLYDPDDIGKTPPKFLIYKMRVSYFLSLIT